MNKRLNSQPTKNPVDVSAGNSFTGELKRISDILPGGLIKVTLPDFLIYCFNQGFCQLTGYTAGDCKKKYFAWENLIIYSKDRDRLNSTLSLALSDHSPFSLQLRIVKKGGELVQVQLMGAYLEEYHGKSGYLCLLTDFSEPYAYKEQQSLEQQRFQLLTRLGRYTLWDYTLSTDSMNRYGSLSLSYSPEPVLQHWKEYMLANQIVHSKDISRFESIFSIQPTEGTPFFIDLRLKNHLGIYQWYKLRYTFLFNTAREPVKIFGQTSHLELPDLQTAAQISLLRKGAAIKKIDTAISHMEDGRSCGFMLIAFPKFAEYKKKHDNALCENLIQEVSVLLYEQFEYEITAQLENGYFLVFLTDFSEENYLQKQAEIFLSSLKNRCLSYSEWNSACNIGLVLGDKSSSNYSVLYKKACSALNTAILKGNLTYDVYGLVSESAAAPALSESLSSYTAAKPLSSPQQQTLEIFTDIDSTDQITKLPSFSSFLKKGRQILSQNNQQNFALIYLDINNFHTFNQNFGFGTGNQILEELGSSLQSSMKENELSCRLEQDYFLILLHYNEKNELYNRLNQRVRNPLLRSPASMLDIYRFDIVCGIYFIPPGQSEISQMVDYANEARKSKKGFTGSHYAIYSPQLSEKSQQQKAAVETASQALYKRDFFPFYQPIYSSDGKQLVGLEALARWRTSSGRLLSPSKFLPALEASGIMADVDFLIMEKAFLFFKEQKEAGLAQLPIFINLSPQHLKTSDFIDRLLALLSRYEVPASSLSLELSEETLIQFPDESSCFINELKAYDFSITIDRLGEKYLPLALLKNLSPDAIKLDISSFCRQGSSEKNHLLLHELIHTSKELGLKVYAGHIEAPSLLGQLPLEDLDGIQGFLYSKPLPAHTLKNLF